MVINVRHESIKICFVTIISFIFNFEKMFSEKNKFARSSSELVDVSLFLLLFFAEDYLRKTMPAQLLDFEISNANRMAPVIMIGGALLGIFTFFRKPPDYSSDDSWIGFFSKAIMYLSALTVAFILFVMLPYGFLEIWQVYFPDVKQSITMSIIFVVLIMAMIYCPFALPAYYMENHSRLKSLNPTLRYFFLLPVMFCASACLNNKLDFGILNALIIFPLCVMGPRLFATGKTIAPKEWWFWLGRFILFFIGLYFDFK